jgi:hypothetical protein
LNLRRTRIIIKIKSAEEQPETMKKTAKQAPKQADPPAPAAANAKNAAPADASTNPAERARIRAATARQVALDKAVAQARG